MGSGKSTVAKALGRILDFAVVEMDDLVYEKTKTKDMQEVFVKGGEMLLRETEIAIAKEYSSVDNVVVSTGGGVVLNKIILDYLRQQEGVVVFLRANFATLSLRLKGDSSRPLFQNRSQALSLYQDRQPLYVKYADKIIDVDGKSVTAIVQEISRLIQ